MGWPSLRHIVDDRGVKRKSYAGPHLGSGTDSTMPESEYRELHRRLRGQEWVWSAILWMLALYFVVRFIRKVASGGFGWDFVPALAFVAVWVFLARRSQTAFPDRPGWWVAEELRRLGRCPSCAYKLTSLPVEADGCTVCSECGAAWRLGGTA
jgi:hypothetical protein